MFRTTCKSCGMPILWVKTRSGKAMPCDIKPIRFRIDDSAQVLERFVTKNGDILFGARDSTGNLEGYISHFATCPQADTWRKR